MVSALRSMPHSAASLDSALPSLTAFSARLLSVLSLSSANFASFSDVGWFLPKPSNSPHKAAIVARVSAS